jgi:predicted kinase
MRFLRPASPRLIAVGGYSGTGKTTLAAALAPGLNPAPGALHIRTDVERKTFFGLAETERLPADCYTKSASDKIYAVVMDKTRRALAAGHSVVIDAVFSKPDERAAIAALADAAGAAFSGLWLTAAPDILKARVAARVDDASDATADVVELQLQRGSGDIDWAYVDAGSTPQTTLAAARRALKLAP